MSSGVGGDGINMIYNKKWQVARQLSELERLYLKYLDRSAEGEGSKDKKNKLGG